MNFWDRYGECISNNEGQARSADDKKRDGSADEQDIRRKFEEYSGKDENELMNELMKTAVKMKSEGTFDEASLKNMYNTAAPFMNEAQRERMRSIIDMLVK